MKELLSSIVTEMSVLGVYKASRPGTSKWSVANHSHRSFYFGLPGLPSKLLLETKGLEIGNWNGISQRLHISELYSVAMASVDRRSVCFLFRSPA